MIKDEENSNEYHNIHRSEAIEILGEMRHSTPEEQQSYEDMLERLASVSETDYNEMQNNIESQSFADIFVG